MRHEQDRAEKAGASPAGEASQAAEAPLQGPLGIIYDIQGFSVQDGPGIRTTVFLKGCPLRCPWCHSPESRRFEIQLSWQRRKCLGVETCGLCLPACPQGALRAAEMAPPAQDRGAAPLAESTAGYEARPGHNATFEHQAAPISEGVALADEPRLVQVDWDKCDDCGACTEVCPTGALSPWGRSYTVAEVLERVLRDRPFFERSGGGVTVSGGEPLSQAAFTLALLRACREAGLHTALDTTGFAPWGVMERTLPYTDLYLLDLKHVDSDKHRAVVGVPNESILENARRLAGSGARIQVRIPVIPRFNDSAEEMNRLGRLVAELGEAVTLVQLLPYHALGVHKWDRIKPEGPVLQAVAPSEKRVAELKAVLEEYALQVQVH